MVQIYKKGQGKYTRIVTFLSVVVMGATAAVALSNFLKAYVSPLVCFGVPTAIVIALGVLALWLVNRQKTADFLIATEGEMKKVSWSSKREIIGSTKVVIVTTFTLAVILFGVDLVFILLFGWLKITPV